MFLSESRITFCKFDFSVLYLVSKQICKYQYYLLQQLILKTLLFTTLLSLRQSTTAVFNFSTSVLSTFAFKLAKSDFAA